MLRSLRRDVTTCDDRVWNLDVSSKIGRLLLTVTLFALLENQNKHGELRGLVRFYAVLEAAAHLTESMGISDDLPGDECYFQPLPSLAELFWGKY